MSGFGAWVSARGDVQKILYEALKGSPYPTFQVDRDMDRGGWILSAWTREGTCEQTFLTSLRAVDGLVQWTEAIRELPTWKAQREAQQAALEALEPHPVTL